MNKLFITLILTALPLFALAQATGNPDPSTGNPVDISPSTGSPNPNTGVPQTSNPNTGFPNPSAGSPSPSNTSTGFPNPATGNPNPSTGNPQPTCSGGACSVQNPIKVTSICGALKQGFYVLMPIVIAIGVVFIIWSGAKFVFAQGNPKELGKARQNFYYTVIGIAVVLGAWVLAEVIAATINAIGGANIISCN